jgi:hypothetical protein
MKTFVPEGDVRTAGSLATRNGMLDTLLATIETGEIAHRHGWTAASSPPVTATLLPTRAVLVTADRR